MLFGAGVAGGVLTAVVGGLLGGRLVRVLPQRLIRFVVITVGSTLTLIYAWRYWGF